MNPQSLLRAERIRRGWTQKYVGHKVGVSKQTIHDIETGKQKPSYDVLLKLLALFNVEHENISRLFAPVEETQPNSNTDKEDVKVREHPAVAAVPSEVSPGVAIEAEAAG
jgi:putative transcriptional regulator